MTRDSVRRGAFLLALPVALLFTLHAESQRFGVRDRTRERYGDVEYEARSDYSRIKVRKLKNVRTMMFVRDSGEEVVETQVNLDRPQDLLINYTQFMFTSYLFKPKQERVLIVGLGGGAMVHFLKHHEPKLKVEVVEIDPVVVQIAEKYFGVKSEGPVKVVTQDGFAYLRKTDGPYDVIYMDAFLKPSPETDETGRPLKLRTLKFYNELQTKLKPDGMVVFNLNDHKTIEDDVRTIRAAFPQTHVFHLPDTSGQVVVGSMDRKSINTKALFQEARDLDKRFGANFNFSRLMLWLER